MPSRLRYVCLLLCVPLLAAACAGGEGGSKTASGASGQDGQSSGKSPSKPITIVVPFGAGGGSDLLSRSVAAVAQKHIGQPVRVELQPGASGVIATTSFVQSADPDGYTLIIVGTSATTTVPFTQKVQYDPIKDFSFVSGLSLNTEVLAVPSDFPADTPKEFVQYAKGHPGEVRLADTGTGGEDWAGIELLSRAIDAKIQSVPFEGGGEAMTAAAGGHVDGAVSSYASAASFVESGKLKVVGVFNGKRSARFPDIPTFAELGYKEAVVDSRLGYAAPKGTPAPVVRELAGDLKEISADPKFKKLAKSRGFAIDYLGPEQWRSTLADTVQRMGSLF